MPASSGVNEKSLPAPLVYTAAVALPCCFVTCQARVVNLASGTPVLAVTPRSAMATPS